MLPGLLLGARREQHEAREVAVEHRQVRDLLRFEARGHVRAVGLQELTAGGVDRHCLRDRAGLEHGVDPRLRVDADGHRRDDLGAEARELDLDLVPPGEQPVLEVVAGRIGGDRVDGAALEARHGHSGPGRPRAARVDDGARDAAVDGLGERRRGRPRNGNQHGDAGSEHPRQAHV
jgi:hypothetical protein